MVVYKLSIMDAAFQPTQKCDDSWRGLCLKNGEGCGQGDQ